MDLKRLIWQSFPQRTSQNGPACLLPMTLISTYSNYHTLVLQVLDVIEIQVVFMQRGIYFHILSAVTVFTVPLWLDDRLSGVLSQTAVWEKGARGKQWGALDSCLLSSQSSLFIFLLRIARSTLQNSKDYFDRIHLCTDLRLSFLEFSFGLHLSVITIYRM